ncbi:MAG TPA: polymer-forming cytoskeletal protein [Leptospiraceae bacterium]|nr:polymer-forming cytoskeletal protein [Leptospiraceae bacterium]HNK99980.1 polymer-forming cytoskeletal protein [Leptospiraceae bacterium]HQI17852.1 polymer-forming cytoskeletal protein [Leptospiraceae bacterium]
MHDHRSVITHSMAISGDLTVDTHLIIEGAISATKIDSKNHTVVVGQYSAVHGDVYGSQILVLGEINGNLFASEKIDIRSTAVINGDVNAPLIKMEEKSRLNGRLNYT